LPPFQRPANDPPGTVSSAAVNPTNVQAVAETHDRPDGTTFPFLKADRIDQRVPV
jgi:hypothetical protein